MDTAQNVLQKHFARLAQAISDPLVVATELFEKGIVSRSLLGRIRDVPAPNHDKSTLLLEAVFDQIADDIGRFETFLAILRKDAPLRPLVDSMETMWGRPRVHGQPRDGNTTGQPRDGNATGQPCGENATGQPRGENAIGQPRGENATGQPHGENATGQPRGENATGQPRGENATGQPRGENATGQPRGENATGQPRGENATGQPHGENAAGQQHGENRENVKKVTNSATPTPDQILAVCVIKETTKTMKHKFTHLLTTTCSKLKEKHAHDIEMFCLFLVSMCDEDDTNCKETLRKILAKCSSFAEIFSALTVKGLWSFWPNYDLLEGVIKEYAPELVQKMDAYTEALSGFLLSTKMADYISSVDPREKVPRYHDLEALSTKIDKVKVTEHSLKYIDDLWRSLVKKFSLPKWALLLHKVEEGCVSITWLVPSCAVHHLDGYMQTPECASYFESMNIMEVMLGNKKYYPHVPGQAMQPSSPTVGSTSKPDPSSQATASDLFWPSSQDTTTGKTALSIFQKHLPDLAVAIKDPGSLARQLYSKGIITWSVQVDADNPLRSRKRNTAILLQAIETKLQSDPSDFTTLIVVLQSDPSLEPIATEILSHHQEHEEVKSKPQSRTIELSWRKGPDAPSEMNAGTTVVDGTMAYFSSRWSQTVYEYDSSKMEWSKLPLHPHRGFSLAIIHGLLTTVGGTLHGNSTILSLMGKDGESRKWREHFPPMPSRRSTPLVVCSGKSLVVAGGELSRRGGSVPPRNYTAIVEVMNTDTLQWFTACGLPHPLSDPLATVVGNSLYIFGKYEGVFTCSLSALLQTCQSQQFTQMVETFSSSQTPSIWHGAADVPVYNSTWATLSGQLLAVGGRGSNHQPTTAVHMYNPTTETWSVISHMSISRANCLVAVLPGDELMVVGGYTSEFSLTDSVEIARVIYTPQVQR